LPEHPIQSLLKRLFIHNTGDPCRKKDDPKGIANLVFSFLRIALKHI
jgi:hypothetical protein